MHTLCVKDRDDPLTEMIAKKIIKIAQTDVRDPAEISALAIKELEISKQVGLSPLDAFYQSLGFCQELIARFLAQRC